MGVFLLNYTKVYCVAEDICDLGSLNSVAAAQKCSHLKFLSEFQPSNQSEEAKVWGGSSQLPINI